MSLPLSGKTIALAEGRQLEDLARLLDKEGAAVLRCPLLSILDVADAKPVNAWLRDLVAGKFDYVILLTGEGLRRLIAFAERAGLKDEVIAALGKTKIVARGPKPVQFPDPAKAAIAGAGFPLRDRTRFRGRANGVGGRIRLYPLPPRTGHGPGQRLVPISRPGRRGSRFAIAPVGVAGAFPAGGGADG